MNTRYLLREETHQQKNHQALRTEEGEEGVEATLTQHRTYLKIQLNSEEITKNKQLNKSKGKASKPCTHWRTSSYTTCPHLQNRKQEVGDRLTLRQPAGEKDPPKIDPTTTKNQRHTESQHKLQLKISKIGRSRRRYHWISQVFYHRSSHHEPRGSD